MVITEVATPAWRAACEKLPDSATETKARRLARVSMVWLDSRKLIA